MQTTKNIDKDKLFELIEFIFSNSEVRIYEFYSEMEKELIVINDFSEFKTYFNRSIAENIKHFGFGIYYPEHKGKISITKFKLDPKRCNGKTYRYKTEGWGFISIHLDIISETQIKFDVSVNSKKRAEIWESTIPEFGSPELWDWKLIESNARKIIYQLKKIAK